jgi:hypothetical protein
VSETEAGTPQGARDTARAYDLALTTNRQTVVFLLRDHGITVADDRLDWEIGGTPDAALLTSIVEVNLRNGGSWTHPIAQCRIRFKDGFILTVSNATSTGYPDDAKRLLYREFVHDLHRRLATLPNLQARFTSGYSKSQFHVLSLCALVVVAIGIGTPVVVFLVSPHMKLALVLIAVVGLAVPLLRMLHDNSPGTYEPPAIPRELLP